MRVDEIWKREKGKGRGRQRGRKGSSTDAKVFQFSTLKHEPTPQLGSLRRLLNKTLIRENTVACALSGTANFNTIQLLLKLFVFDCSKKRSVWMKVLFQRGVNCKDSLNLCAFNHVAHCIYRRGADLFILLYSHFNLLEMWTWEETAWCPPSLLPLTSFGVYLAVVLVNVIINKCLHFLHRCFTINVFLHLQTIVPPCLTCEYYMCNCQQEALGFTKNVFWHKEQQNSNANINAMYFVN